MRRDSPRDPLVDHVGRVLVLIDAFTGRSASLQGLAKLARLDFLLRYPTYLEQVLEERGRPLAFKLRPTLAEREAPETAYIRWKYGPWDERYSTLLGRLVGQRLIEVTTRPGVMALRSNGRGAQVVAGLDGAEWELVRGRAKALRRGADLSAAHLGRLTAPLLSTTETA